MRLSGIWCTAVRRGENIRYGTIYGDSWKVIFVTHIINSLQYMGLEKMNIFKH